MNQHPRDYGLSSRSSSTFAVRRACWRRPRDRYKMIAWPGPGRRLGLAFAAGGWDGAHEFHARARRRTCGERAPAARTVRSQGPRLCRPRSRHQQLPAAHRAPGRAKLPRHRRLLAHRAPGRGDGAGEPSLGGRGRAHARGAQGVCCQDAPSRRHPRPRGGDRGVPARGQRGELPRPRRGGDRARARGHLARRGGAPRGHRLPAATRPPVSAMPSSSTSAAVRPSSSGSRRCGQGRRACSPRSPSRSAW